MEANNLKITATYILPIRSQFVREAVESVWEPYSRWDSCGEKDYN